MLIGIFAILSFTASVIYGFAASVGAAGLWKCALIFVLGVPALTLLYVLFAALISLFIRPVWPREKQNPLCRSIIAGGGNICCFYCAVRTHVNGAERIPETGRFLFVANHRSLFDPLALFHAMRRYNMAFVSKPSNMRIPVLGRIAYGDCFLPIDRENNREALKTILCAADYLKRDICSFCIFPEGTRSKSREMLPFHHGSFKIAQRAGVPLVIAAISGTDLVKKNVLRRPTDVYIDVLEVIPAEEVRASSTAELSDRARELIENALKKREGET